MKYQAFFIGTRAFVYSPPFAKLQSAQNWIKRNRHRAVEGLQIIKYDPKGKSKTEWYSETGIKLNNKHFCSRFHLSLRADPRVR